MSLTMKTNNRAKRPTQTHRPTFSPFWTKNCLKSKSFIFIFFMIGKPPHAKFKIRNSKSATQGANAPRSGYGSKSYFRVLDFEFSLPCQSHFGALFLRRKAFVQGG